MAMYNKANSRDEVEQEIERVSADLDKFIAEVLKKQKIVWNARHQDHRVSKRFFSVQSPSIEDQHAKETAIRCSTWKSGKKKLSEKNDVESMWKTCGKRVGKGRVENHLEKHVLPLRQKNITFLIPGKAPTVTVMRY